MSGQSWWLNNQEQLTAFTQWIHSEWADGRQVTVQVKRPDRTTDQNSMLHELIHEVSLQKQDETVIEIKRYIKLHFGVPILRTTDDEFREKYDQSVKHLPYEQKLLAMDLLPVTSRMDKDQFSKLLDTVIQHYQAAGFELSRR